MAKMNVSKTNVAKPKIEKKKTKRASTLSVTKERGRKALITPELAKRAAKGQTTKLWKKGLSRRGASEQKGEALKKGIEGMARRINLDEETFSRIMEMDEQSLEAMYENNDIIFEVVFSYSGVETDPETGAYVLEEDRTDDFQFLIEQYNRLFPESAV